MEKLDSDQTLIFAFWSPGNNYWVKTKFISINITSEKMVRDPQNGHKQS